MYKIRQKKCDSTRLEDVRIKLGHGLKILIIGGLECYQFLCCPVSLAGTAAAAGLRAALGWESRQGSLPCWLIFNLSQLLDQAQVSSLWSSCCDTAEVNTLGVEKICAGQGWMAGAASVDLAAKINVDHSSPGMQHSREVLPWEHWCARSLFTI